MRAQRVRVTASGSFHRHLSSIRESVEILTACGADVLSPADPRVVDKFGEFLFVASDLRRSIRGIQNRHLDAIRTSSFVRLECDDGYIGLSAAFETGYAVARDIPVVASHLPRDPLIQRHVTVAADPIEALHLTAHAIPQPNHRQLSLLLTPNETIEAAHGELERLELVAKAVRHTEIASIQGQIYRLRQLLMLPVYPKIYDRDLDAIRSLRFGWLQNQDGYIDASTAFKIGYAIALGVPVFSNCPPNDLTLRQYISNASSQRHALGKLQGLRRPRRDPNQLSLSLDPRETFNAAHLQLQKIYVDLVSPVSCEVDPIEERIDQLHQLLVCA